MSCAQKQGLAPLQQMITQSGMTQEDLENLNNQMAEMFGTMNMDDFIQSLPQDNDSMPMPTDDNGEDDTNSMLRFINSAFSKFDHPGNRERRKRQVFSETNKSAEPRTQARSLGKS